MIAPAGSPGVGSHLSRFSLERPVTILVLFLSTLVVGAVATSGIPVELVPRGFDPPFLQVSAPWPDAPPREVLDKVTVPLEEEISTVRGISHVASISVLGRSRLWLSFKQGTNMNLAYREVRDRIERARRLFPADIDQVRIRKEDDASIPVLVLGVAVDQNVGDSYNLLQKGLIEPIKRVEGVAAVSANGLEEKEVLIELDRRSVESAGLNVYDLSQNLADDNFTLPSGKVFDADRKLLLRSVARFRSVEELRRKMIAPGLRLGDVAAIRYEEPEKDYRVRAMGEPAVAVVVLKEGDANAREVSGRLHRLIKGMEHDPRLQGIRITTLFDQGGVIDESLSTMLQSGLIGGFLAAAVLLFFLRRFRLTIIIAFSIPVSMVIALTVMYFTGESLNILSLLGLMICIGLLVDNSVVVAENIHRLHQEGLSPRLAAIEGAGEVALAITMSTLTTIIAFLPAALVEGDARFFLIRLALPICVSLAGSLVIALLFVPLCVYLTLPSTARETPKTTLSGLRGGLRRVSRAIYDQSFGRISQLYGALLRWSLSHRLELVSVVFLLLALTIAYPFGAALPEDSSRKVRFTDVQENERSGFYVGVEMPPDTTLDEAEEWFLAAQKVIQDHQREWDLAGYFHFHRKHSGEIQGWFNRPRTNDLTAEQVTGLFLEAVPVKPGFTLHTSQESQVDADRGENRYTVTLTAEDPEILERVARELTDALTRVEGVLGAKKNLDVSDQELGLIIDRQRARQYGADPRVVAGVVGYALRGRSLPRFHGQGKEIPVRVRFQKQDREELSELETFLVPTATGPLALGALTDARPLDAAPRIFRRDKKVSRSIVLELTGEGREKTRERLDAFTSSLALPEGVSLDSRSRREDFDNDFSSLRFALLLSVVFIYLLMGFLFESVLLPLSIVLTIPLAAIGVGWIHFATGRDIDFLGAVGIVLLVGVVVNNGIVLIDTVGRLRASGRERTDALILAAERRFRPIMMTAITTVGGMVPLAFAGTNRIGLSYTSFSLTLIGGMTTATLLTLLVVPVFYTLFDDAGLAFGRSITVVLTPRTSSR